jgi:hypothetical protein
MRFSFWLRNWKRCAPAARRRTRTSPRQRASFRPWLEALEDRLVPSGGGPHPGHGSGSGGGSGGSGGGLPYATAATTSQLIANINYANKAGGAITINLKPNTTFDLNQINNTSYSYYNANALPIIGGTKAVNLTILGNGDTIAWAGGSTYSNVEVRLLEVAKLGSLTLDHVSLQNGAAIDGGAVYNQGTLKVIDHSTLSGNGGSDGGGVYNAGGTVSISNSILSGNSALFGGGIYNSAGTVTLSNSTLSGNTAVTPRPGYGESGGNGGGIYNTGGKVVISNSTLSGNIAAGGAIGNVGGTVTLSNSTLSGNSGNGIDINGGTVLVNTCTLTGNSGSAITIDAGTLTISNSTLSDNSAYYGGGIYVNGGTVSVIGCTLTGNSAKTGSYDTTSGSTVTYGGVGGGIYVGSGTLTVKNSGFNNSPDNIFGPYTDDGGNTGL